MGACDQRVQGYIGSKAPHLKTTGFRAKGKLLEMEELKQKEMKTGTTFRVYAWRFMGLSNYTDSCPYGAILVIRDSGFKVCKVVGQGFKVRGRIPIGVQVAH